MKSAGKARNNGLYRHIRTSKEIIRNLLNDCIKTKEAQVMLNENIKNLRKAKGLSQEELAIKLNVVRQTVSKWEKGGSLR